MVVTDWYAVSYSGQRSGPYGTKSEANDQSIAMAARGDIQDEPRMGIAVVSGVAFLIILSEIQ